MWKADDVPVIARRVPAVPVVGDQVIATQSVPAKQVDDNEGITMHSALDLKASSVDNAPPTLVDEAPPASVGKPPPTRVHNAPSTCVNKDSAKEKQREYALKLKQELDDFKQKREMEMLDESDQADKNIIAKAFKSVEIVIHTKTRETKALAGKKRKSPLTTGHSTTILTPNRAELKNLAEERRKRSMWRTIVNKMSPIKTGKSPQFKTIADIRDPDSD